MNIFKSRLFICILLLTVTITLFGQTSAYYTGDGRADMRMTILELEGHNLAPDQTYLGNLIQNVLVTNISKYSGINVVDRIALDRAIHEQLDGIYPDFSQFVMIGQIAQSRYILSGSITRTTSGFNLFLSITDTQAEGTRSIASHASTPTISQLDDHSAILIATRNLLEQIGVELTTQALNEINSTISQYQITAQANLARGVAASRTGTSVEALSYFYQAAVLDPSLFEATYRANSIETAVSTGNIGVDARNDIVLRNAWRDRLKETEEFFYSLLYAADPPYTLFFSNNLQQVNVNYDRGTVDLGFDINLRANTEWFLSVAGSMERVANAVYSGLHSTGKATAWNLANWPTTSLTLNNPFNKLWANEFAVVIELLNSRNSVISTWSGMLDRKYGVFFDKANGFTTSFEPDYIYTLGFKSVRADDITDNLSIRVKSINGLSPQQAKISVVGLSGDVFERYENALAQFSIINGVLVGFDANYLQMNETPTSLNIPSGVWNERIIVNKIGEFAFENKQLVSITLTQTVTFIGKHAFAGNLNLHSIFIGENVVIDANAFDNRFEQYYHANGRKAGTYIYSRTGWAFREN